MALWRGERAVRPFRRPGAPAQDRGHVAPDGRRFAMLVVIAIGGKGLLGGHEGLDADAHRAGARAVVNAIADVARHHTVVVTHGSASQVGLLAYQSALSRQGSGYPLDIVEAETEGFLGYVLQQALQNE